VTTRALATRLCMLFLVSGGAPLHAEDICNGGTLPLCFDAGDPDLSSGTDVTRYTAADDFVLTTSGEEVGLRVDFWVVQGPADWDGTLEYFIFEDVADPSSQSGRGPAASPLYSGAGQGISREFTGRIGSGSLPGFREFKYSFRFENKLLLNSGQVYWLGLHLSADHGNDFLFWETAHVEAPSYPPGIGYASLRQAAFQSVFANFTDSFASKQQLAFKIYENPAHVPSVSPTGGLVAVAILAASGAALRRRNARF
jgi:hypothetical protein